MDSIYNYKAKRIDGEEINFKSFEGKKILIVNTASECGFTPQLSQLQELYEEFNDKLVVVAFPSNDFGNQEPGSNDEIAYFCTKNYEISFPITEKCKVIGEDQHLIFRFLTNKELNNTKDYMIEWNFYKFLISEEGKVLNMYTSSIDPLSEEIISQL